jgi:hypothetical protein
MKWLLGLLILVCVSNVLANGIVINQVLYDPVGTENGGEAIQLYNPTEQDVNLDGLIIKTKSSGVDANITGTIKASGYFLIADNGWDESKDNPSWPSADYEEAITLGNADAGLALILNGVVLDALGWGAAPEDLFLGNSALDVEEGLALKRIGFNDDNSLDFESGALEFVEEENDDIDIEFDVLNSEPEILNVEFEREILPIAGQNKEINLSVEVKDNNGFEDLVSVKVVLEGSEFTLSLINNSLVGANYSGSFNITSSLFAGENVLYVVVDDGSVIVNKSELFNITSLIALSVDVTSLSFSSVKPNEESIILGDDDFQTASPTIKNIGNVALDLGVSGPAVANNDQTIENGLLFSFDNDFNSELSAVVEEDYNLVDLNLDPGAYTPLGLKLFVPVGTAKGSFSGSLSIVGVMQ